MEVIFVKTVHGIGTKGHVRNVKPGFFRNYLYPKGIAVLATESAKKVWNNRRELEMIAKEELNKKALELQGRLTGKTILIKKKVTKKGTLYSAVTAKDLAKALAEQAQIEVNAKTLALKESLKQVGKFEVPVALAEGVEVKISLEIQPLEGEKK